MIVCAIASGCANNKKHSTTGMTANAGSLDVPAAPPAPPAQFTPQQPVIAEAPQQPMASASDAPADEIAPEPAAAPRRAAPAPHARTASAVSGGSKYKIKKGDSL